jgi:DEAD/DEAH box helicase domain-containing protein
VFSWESGGLGEQGGRGAGETPDFPDYKTTRLSDYRYNSPMTLSELLAQLRLNRDFISQVVAWERFPPRPARFGEVTAVLDPRILAALQTRGVGQFFTHQAAAIEAALNSQDVIIATATASGKSLCYTVPVLQRLLDRPSARALYLFPTKALAQDQLAETVAIIGAGKLPIAAHTYDGDTPQSRRAQVRRAGGILISNPDMLHAGMLPYHPTWRDLFANLQFIVLDEIHTYRGVFGSHVANVLRRLLRICDFYGARPQVICCSATIANPQEHAERLVGRPFSLINEKQNGAPTGEKHVILYNPPIINAELGLRGSAVMAARDAAITFLAEDVQTIAFARTRQTVELLLTYLRDEMKVMGKEITAVSGYRGGYLPLERRDIEQGLRSGALRGVVATNALELGIDIGELDAAVLTGYPGSIASTWQQIGRAGRRAAQSVAVMIASNNPLDQYICLHPRYLFGQTPEHALTNPDNLRIMARHLLCAAYELPFRADESFGDYPAEVLLHALEGEGMLHRTREQYHYVGEGAPATAVSLRTSGDDNIIVHDLGEELDETKTRAIGEVDLDRAPTVVHEGAIYMHLARSYLVEHLDWEGRLAFVRPVNVDYYTRASVGSSIRELRATEDNKLTIDNCQLSIVNLYRAWGEVTVVTQATGYRRIKRYTQETLGFGEIDLPEMTLETDGYWLIFGEALTEQLYETGILLRPNDYGPNWQTQRQKALERDGHRCQICGAQGKDEDLTGFPEPVRSGVVLHVHHKRPFREFSYTRGVNENYLDANKLENLVTLCPACHRQAEAGQQARSALGGLAYVLRNLAPLYLMCDPGDIQVTAESRSPLTQAPTLVVYERAAAGVGFSQRLFELHDTLLAAALELVTDCRCRDGCPACVGPPGEIGPETKGVTRRLLRMLTP